MDYEIDDKIFMNIIVGIRIVRIDKIIFDHSGKNYEVCDIVTGERYTSSLIHEFVRKLTVEECNELTIIGDEYINLRKKLLNFYETVEDEEYD